MQYEHKTYQNTLGLPISVMKTQNGTFASHWHYDFEAVFLLRGGVTVTRNGAPAWLAAGDVFICAGGEIHSYTEPTDDFSVLVLIFDPFAARKAGTLVMDSPVRSGIFRPDPKNPDAGLMPLLKKLLDEYEHLSQASAFFLYAYILEIQGILHRYYHKREFPDGGADSRPHLHAIRESISYIEKHFAGEITLKSMAKAALMSESSFSREFKKITGTGFKEYLNLVRLREVAAAMGQGEAGVAAIAYACGFQSVRTFNRVFRAHFGMTPVERQKRLRTGAAQ
ncbi:MAG TPA: helix-turn-helix domain-containing protein [Candidatus Limiplasma sp.]|nr:helix-turn-helix domain-containing protein [Candidatus Limiplasma sp.]HRX09360.1 helix-turn-helix domain-containing protein [Candidatus Limiplasma sp.]